MPVLNVHPAAEIFPMMPAAEIAALAADIAANGLREPIVALPDGRILDGRNRALACEEAGVEPTYRTWEGEEKKALAFVLSANLHRRHLDESQRAMVGARAATLERGRPSENASIEAFSQNTVADLLHVARSSIQRAKGVLENGAPEVIAAVDAGELAVSVAAELAQAAPEVQREVLQKGTPKAVAKAARKVGREARAAKKRQEAAAPSTEDLTLTAPRVELPILNDAAPLPRYILLDTWKQMPEAEQRAALTLRAGDSTFNKQSTDSIEWAQFSWNPVTGCRHDCPYCYARDIAMERYEQKFEPTLLPTRFGAPQNTKVPKEAAGDVAFRNVFTCSMADLFGRWVPREWIDAVLKVVGDNPQWNFLFLTKFPKRYEEFEAPPNAWLGTTVDCQARVKNAEDAFERIGGGTKWLSVEPLLEPLRFTRLELFDWIVIGGSSRSSQTPDWVPPIDWIADLHQQARAAGCRIYYKHNCGMMDSLRLREFPWTEKAPKRLPDSFRYLPSIQDA